MSEKLRLADYIVQRLVEHGVRHIFLVTGGGAMHLNDAIGRSPEITYVCNHHEQACAIAAEGYARTADRVGVINVTAGPGGINALNGVFGAFTDSIPMLVISGQTKRETCMASYNLPGLRQLGDQEVDIVSMVKKITKYAKLVEDPTTIRFELEKALHLVTSGRPGPCWLDIPVDVQAAAVDPGAMPGYSPDCDPLPYDLGNLPAFCKGITQRLRNAKRPVLLVGSGVRASGALAALDEVSHLLGIPIATAWLPDLIASDNPYYCGRQGTIGTRAGNFTVQNSDFLLIVGSRMAIRQISYNWQAFARHAYKIHVDADPAELKKPTNIADETFCCDAKLFFEALAREVRNEKLDPAQHAEWLHWCRDRVAKYPAVLPGQRTTHSGINPYYFVETLFEQLGSDDVVVCGDATACITPFQVAQVKRGQRVFSNSGCASMGYDLPAAIGAAVAREGKRVVCLAGDGSLMMNVQELQTLAHYRLPIVLFVLSNGGYLSIRNTQSNFFGKLVGEGPDTGVSFPDMLRLAEAHGLPAVRLQDSRFKEQIAEALAHGGPILCEVILDRAQGFEPKLSSRKLADGRMVTAPLEDMAPFLDRDELRSNMLVPVAEAWTARTLDAATPQEPPSSFAAPFVRADSLRGKLEYLLQSGGRELEPLTSNRLAIYGAGGCGQKIARLARENNLDVVAFIDARANGTVGADGIPRVTPDSREARTLAAEGLPVVLGIYNHAVDLAPIARLLTVIGFDQVVSYSEFHEQFGTCDDFWVTKRASYVAAQEEIIRGLEIFADKKSRAVYYECLAYRLNLDRNLLRNPDISNHYLPNDLPKPATPMRLIDGGAFDGDTLRLFVEKGIRFEAVAAFEPDAHNYAQLCATATKLGDKLGEVTLVPCAVGERTEVLTFQSGDGAASSLAENGSANTQVVRLDDMLPRFAPTFIKLDIEGAEPVALHGARTIIERDKPRLAVCVYHQPEHLWTLPRLMRDLNPSYNLSLRYHQWNGFDMVAYAY